MKHLIRKLTPQTVYSRLAGLFRRLRGGSPGPAFTKEKYDSLEALKCAVTYNAYGGYCVPLSAIHRPAARKLMSNEIYEPKTLEFMTANCGTGDVVHAGTFFGDFLPALAKACAPGARVWAFEPNSESYRCASVTVQINDLANVELTHAGLGRKKEILHLKTSDEKGQPLGGGSRIVTGNGDISSGTERVPVVSVDEIVDHARDVSIIQLDVEGHEEEALMGAMGTIRRCLPILLVETQLGDALLEGDWFSRNILALGYRKEGDVHGNAIFICHARE